MITALSVCLRRMLAMFSNIRFLIGYFDSDSHSLKTDLVKVADQLSEKFRFAYTTAKEILDKAGHTK
jgi:hypothetical protein